MHTYRSRVLDATKILTRRELAAVLNDLKRKAPRSENTRLNLVLFRLKRLRREQLTTNCCSGRARDVPSLRIDPQRDCAGTSIARGSAMYDGHSSPSLTFFSIAIPSERSLERRVVRERPRSSAAST